MKISDIKALAELVRKNNLSALDLSEGELHIRIENAPAPQSAPAPEAAAPQEAAPVPAPAPAPAVDNGPDFGAARMIVSPMVGVFYASPSPDDPPFVKVGQKVHKGDVLCIIEAMKLMNEIEAECDGVVKEILVKNEQMVEYGQRLIRIAAE